MSSDPSRVIRFNTTTGSVTVCAIYDGADIQGFTFEDLHDGETYANGDVDIIYGKVRVGPPGLFNTDEETFAYARTIMFAAALHAKDDQLTASLINFAAFCEPTAQ